MSREAEKDEASIRLTRADIELLSEMLLTAYAVRHEMDNVTYYDLQGKLFLGCYELARLEAERQISREWRR